MDTASFRKKVEVAAEWVALHRLVDRRKALASAIKR
jgi:hypothetical protein